jgi:hypothetical protein
VAAAQRYVAKLLDVSAIDGVVIDAPVKEGSQTTAVAAAVRALLAERGITVRLLATSDLLRTYTHPGLHHRSELRRIVETFWASLPTAVGRTRAVVLEAAAAALYDQTMGALNASPT